MKTGKAKKQLTESICEVLEMSAILQKDLTISLEKLIPLVTTFNPETSDSKQAVFWAKTTIRCFMGLIDGLSFSMRQAVRRNAKAAGLTLTPKEQSALKNSYLPTLDSFKLAFRTLPRLFGSDYSLNTGGEDWRGLQRITKVRNNFTHPHVLEDLSIHPAFPALLPTIAWVYREVVTLLGDIGQRLGLGPLWNLPEFGIPAFRESQSPWIRVFKDEGYSLIKGSGGRTLDYVKHMFFMLSDDTKEAMAITRDAFLPHDALLSPMVKFAFRTYARTLFSEIEGTISAVGFFIDAAVERKKVMLSESDKAAREEGEIEDRFVAACNLWAREFGNDYVLQKGGLNWKHLRGARAFRNRITHPKSLESLRVDSDLMDTMLGAHGFFMEGWGEGLYLDSDKWAEKAGGIDELIEKEEAQTKEDLESDSEEA